DVMENATTGSDVENIEALRLRALSVDHPRCREIALQCEEFLSRTMLVRDQTVGGEEQYLCVPHYLDERTRGLIPTQTDGLKYWQIEHHPMADPTCHLCPEWWPTKQVSKI